MKKAVMLFCVAIVSSIFMGQKADAAESDFRWEGGYDATDEVKGDGEEDSKTNTTIIYGFLGQSKDGHHIDVDQDGESDIAFDASKVLDATVTPEMYLYIIGRRETQASGDDKFITTITDTHLATPVGSVVNNGSGKINVQLLSFEEKSSNAYQVAESESNISADSFYLELAPVEKKDNSFESFTPLPLKKYGLDAGGNVPAERGSIGVLDEGKTGYFTLQGKANEDFVVKHHINSDEQTDGVIVIGSEGESELKKNGKASQYQIMFRIERTDI